MIYSFRTLTGDMEQGGMVEGGKGCMHEAYKCMQAYIGEYQHVYMCPRLPTETIFLLTCNLRKLTTLLPPTTC